MASGHCDLNTTIIIEKALQKWKMKLTHWIPPHNINNYILFTILLPGLATIYNTNQSEQKQHPFDNVPIRDIITVCAKHLSNRVINGGSKWKFKFEHVSSHLYQL